MKYVPDIGDIVDLGFPQAQVLVLSPASYNDKTSLMLCCPLTTKIKGYPFEVIIPENQAVLSDQIKSLDWRKREAQFKDKISKAALDEVKAKLNAILTYAPT